MSFSIHWGPQ